MEIVLKTPSQILKTVIVLNSPKLFSPDLLNILFDLFLAYTSAVFAMLGLRSMFFVIDVLVKLFSLLKYGVAAVLVFIGIKLIISKMYHIPPMVVMFILFGTLASSMVASVIKDKWEKAAEEEALQKKMGDDEKETLSPGAEEKGTAKA